MFSFKKVVVVLGALAGLAVPAVASADDRVARDNHAVVVERDRVDHGRDRVEHGAVERDHNRWEDRRFDHGRHHGYGRR